MKENKLAELSMEFSVDIIKLVKTLKDSRESVISNQIGRSATSIGANIYEAQYAQGKKDFISKLEIALKEAIASLGNREKRILSLRFFQGKTQVEVANEIGISQAQVSRLEKGALNKIKSQI